MIAHLNWIVPITIVVMSIIIPVVGTYGINYVVNKKLYQSDGAPIYVSKDECSRLQTACSQRICMQWDQVKKEISDVKGGIRDNRDTVLKAFDKITDTLHEHDVKRERARVEFTELVKQVVRLEVKSDT